MTYTYKCSKCETVYIFVQKITDEPYDLCPSCFTPTLIRQISWDNNGIVFKGDQWAGPGKKGY